ncbi:hypothetical protein D3C72_1779460 [compost metagenome]
MREVKGRHRVGPRGRQRRLGILHQLTGDVPGIGLLPIRAGAQLAEGLGVRKDPASHEEILARHHHLGGVPELVGHLHRGHQTGQEVQDVELPALEALTDGGTEGMQRHLLVVGAEIDAHPLIPRAVAGDVEKLEATGILPEAPAHETLQGLG